MNPFIINVARMKDGVSEPVEITVAPKQLDIDYVDFHFTRDVVLNGAAEKILNTLTFRGSLTRSVELTCARCLKTVEERADEPLQLSYEIGGAHEIDLTNDVRDALIFSRPDHFLCDPNCKGLCPNCGANLNAESCTCKTNAKPVASQTRTEGD